MSVCVHFLCVDFQMAEHEATVCPRKTLHCAFHTLGCNAEVG